MVEHPDTRTLNPGPHPSHVFRALHAGPVLLTGVGVDGEGVAPLVSETIHVRERLCKNAIHPVMIGEMAT